MKLFWLVVIVLALPILPALLADAEWDQRLEAFAAGESEPPSATAACIIGGLLAADIFLPIPSGPLATLAGARLGLLGAIATVWVGLVGGAAFGFTASRWWGRPLARRFAGEEQLQQLDEVFGGQSGWMLLVTRPMPVVAEAAVLLSGVAGVPWRRFLPPIVFGNLVFATVLALVGRYAAANEWLVIAIVLSALLPTLATLWLRKQWRDRP